MLVQRYKPQGTQGISIDQVEVMTQAVSHSNFRITSVVTLIASVIAILAIAIRNQQNWLWWMFVGSVCVAFLMIIWIHTRTINSFPQKALFSITNGTWVLILFSAFDIVLAIASLLAVLIVSPSPLPPVQH